MKLRFPPPPGAARQTMQPSADTPRWGGEELGVIDAMVALKHITNISRSTRSATFNDYIGDYRNLFTFFRGDTPGATRKGLPSKGMPPLTVMAGELHHIFRHDLPRHFNVKLDKERLDDQAAGALNGLEVNIHAYRAAVKEKMEREGLTHLPSDEAQKAPELIPINEACERLLSRLDASSLGRGHALVPLLVDGQPVAVRNTGEVALAILCFTISSEHLNDSTKMPAPLQTFIQHHIGAATEIPERMIKQCEAAPPLGERFTQALAACMPAVRSSAVKAAHTLQVLNTLRRSELDDAGGSLAKLLSIAGAPSHPERLQTAAECKLVLESLQRGASEGDKRIIKELDFMPHEQLQHSPYAEELAAQLSTRRESDWIGRLQTRLVQGFAGRGQQFAAQIEEQRATPPRHPQSTPTR